VAAVIIDVRLGAVDHRNNNAQVFNLSLDKADYDAIDAVCTNSNNLFDIIGDVVMSIDNDLGILFILRECNPDPSNYLARRDMYYIVFIHHQTL
jgi:hypothetical protein